MAVTISRISSWFWNGKGKEKSVPRESLKLNTSSSKKKVKNQKWKSKIEWECEFVMVPSGGDHGIVADEAADWSIGWMEPHGPGFNNEDSFAVLVPSYTNRSKEVVEGSNLEPLAAIKNLQNHFSPESKKYMELLLSSMQDSEA